MTGGQSPPADEGHGRRALALDLIDAQSLVLAPILDQLDLDDAAKAAMIARLGGIQADLQLRAAALDWPEARRRDRKIGSRRFDQAIAALLYMGLNLAADRTEGLPHGRTLRGLAQQAPAIFRAGRLARQARDN